MQKAIEVTNLCKRYSQEVLKNFSLSVNEGEMVVLLGESGSGKVPLSEFWQDWRMRIAEVSASTVFPRMNGFLPIKEI